MTEWRKARKKPVEGEAWGPWGGVRCALPFGVSSARGAFGWQPVVVKDGALQTLLAPGDYIIRHADGRLEVCKPDVFEATYEAVVTMAQRLEPDGETMTIEATGKAVEELRGAKWPDQES